ENDKRALTALVKVMDTGPMTKQAMRMAAASMGIKDADKFTSPQLIEKMFDEIKKDPTNAPKKIEGVVNDLEGLHRALVKGNTEIYSNVVPAFNVYLDAESKGENGVEALKKAGYGKPSGATFVTPTDKDPQGFLVSAFSDYKGAKILDDKAKIADAKGSSHKAEATELRSQRDAMMHQANLKIGAQEQMSILQQPAIFGDPKVAGLLKAMNGTMTLKDKLLPDGSYRDNGLIPENKAGSDHGWAVFEARMGVREASTEIEKKVAIKVKDENGITHLYVPTGTTDEMIKNHQLLKGGNGTISQYFADNLRDSEMTTNKPRGMTEIYTDNNQGQVTFKDRVFDGIGFATPLGMPTPSPATLDLVNTTVPYVTGKLYDELFK
ncbi:MAG: hypothetical protein H7263_05685, partial [Candidatus Sericytochromatia bacterium]|nr:hypothetical protein [Candidatus Sericytochromatia bacterium]